MITSIYHFIQEMETLHPDRIAFQFYDEEIEQVRKITYTQFIKDVRQCAAYLMKTVPNVEDRRVGVLAKSGYYYAVDMIGIMLTGAVAVPLNVMETWENIEDQIRISEIACLFQDGEYSSVEPELEKEFASLLKPMDVWTDTVCDVEFRKYADPDRQLVLMYTSGTTGKCKGVMLQVRGLAHLRYEDSIPPQYVYRNKFGNNCCDLSNLLTPPIYHSAGLKLLMCWLALGCTVNLIPQMKYMYRDLELLQPNYAFAVPAIFKMWLRDIRKGRREKLGRIHSIMVGGAITEPQDLEEMLNNGIFVIIGYGLTETWGNGLKNMIFDDKHLNALGKPQAGVEAKIVDGEICLKGYCVMSGYFQMPEETKETLTEGCWLHTGDLGRMDDDGYIYLTGRKKNLIILDSGENVSPEELENLLSRNLSIQESVVKEKDYKICAEIFCEESCQEQVREYISEMNVRLPLYKRISLIEFRTEPFSKTAFGKIKRVF